MILQADARQIPLVDGCVQCCVTSPPYWGLRDYGYSQQIGLESTPDAYVAQIVAVFREVRRVLRDDGTVWLNLGDSYTGSGKGGNPEEGKQATNKGSQSIGVLYGKTRETARQAAVTNVTRRFCSEIGAKPKDLVGIPWRVAFALQADGWYLRSDIIWAKPNQMPESVTDRPTKAHEYLFLLTKGQWVSRVVQFSDAPGDIVHFGKHIGSEKPLVRESITKFSVSLASAIFNGAQRQHDFSLPPFYSEEWKQLRECGRGDAICNHPTISRLTAESAGFLSADRTTKSFLEKMDCLWLDLRARDALLVRRVESILGSPSVNIDSDGTITVNDSSEIGQFKFGHNQIVAHRSSTCSYYYDADAIAEPVSDAMFAQVEQGYDGEGLKDYEAAGVQNPSSVKARIIGSARKRADRFGGNKHNGETSQHSDGSVYTGRFTRNKRSVWTIPTQPYSGAHFATMPEALIEPCILAGCPIGGIVLDPFFGSGTVGAVAERLSRRWVGLDLTYQPLSKARTAQRGLQFERTDEDSISEGI